MKILIYSPNFFPLVGGLETITGIIAQGISDAGHEVAVICNVDYDSKNPFNFRVIRNPNFIELFKEVKNCDVYFQANISLKGLYPLLLLNRPWVVNHHGYYERPEGIIGWQDKLKLFLAKFSNNISVSNAVANSLGSRSVIIPNTYDESTFYYRKEVVRNNDLIFVGRLVSDKGVDSLIIALSHLKNYNIRPQLSIVGKGEDQLLLEKMVREHYLETQIKFLGVKTGGDLAKIMNSHKILVVPSKWNEPFGIVALEGIACGCALVGSEGGGLKDAIGPCGLTFKNGDAEDLARCLKLLLTNDQLIDKLCSHREEHLKKFRKEVVIKQYLDFIENVVMKNRSERI